MASTARIDGSLPARATIPQRGSSSRVGDGLITRLPVARCRGLTSPSGSAPLVFPLPSTGPRGCSERWGLLQFVSLLVQERSLFEARLFHYNGSCGRDCPGMRRLSQHRDDERLPEKNTLRTLARRVKREFFTPDIDLALGFQALREMWPDDVTVNRLKFRILLGV